MSEDAGWPIDECVENFSNVEEALMDSINYSIEKETPHCALCANDYLYCAEQSEPYLIHNHLRDDLKLNYCPACGTKLKQACNEIDPNVWKARLSQYRNSLSETKENENESSDIKRLMVDKVDYRSENGEHQLIIDDVKVKLVSASINYVTKTDVPGTDVATFVYYMPGDLTPRIISVDYRNMTIFQQ